MSALADWNSLPERDALVPMLACCGSRAFASRAVESRPFPNPEALVEAAEGIWWSLSQSDWLEAFAAHPRIGEAHANRSSQFAAWSTQEQAAVQGAESSILHCIAEKNGEYEARHGFIYIVYAAGKSAEELLAILDRRLKTDTQVELEEAAEQQMQITKSRLRKWLTL